MINNSPLEEVGYGVTANITASQFTLDLIAVARGSTPRIRVAFLATFFSLIAFYLEGLNRHVTCKSDALSGGSGTETSLQDLSDTQLCTNVHTQSSVSSQVLLTC